VPVERRTIPTEGVIALEGIGGHIVDVDVITRRNVLAGEADDLAILVDGLSARNGAESELVSESHAGVESQGCIVEDERLTGL